MLYLVGISLFVVVLCALAVVFFLLKDRDYWRSQYQTLDKESRERERSLFDQSLRRQGAREVGASLEPVKSSSPYPAIGDDDIELMTDRINERVEAGMMTYGEAKRLVEQVTYGEKTKAQVDLILFERQREAYTGSVLDIE